MKKVLCAIVGAVGVASVLYAAYETGRGKGYTDGLRDAEEKHKCDCDCHCCPDEVLRNDLEAEGEAKQAENTEGSMSDTSTASTETETE